MKEIHAYSIQGQQNTTDSKYIKVIARVIGQPPQDGQFLICPSRELVRIKECEPGDKDDEVILSLKGSGASYINRGALLMSTQEGASVGKKALIAWKSDPLIAKDMTLSLRDYPEERFVAKLSCDKKNRYAFVRATQAFMQIPGQIYRVETRGQQADFVLVMAEPFSPDEMKSMRVRVEKYKNFPGPESIYSMNLRVRGAIFIPPHMAKAEFDGAVKIGDWMIMSRIADRILSFIEKRAKSEGGIQESEVREKWSDMNSALIQTLVDHLISENKVYRQKGYILNVTDDPSAFLSPFSKSFLKEVEEAGEAGLSLQGVVGRDEIIGHLSRRNLIVRIESALFSYSACDALMNKLKEAFPGEDSIALTELRDDVSSFISGRSRLIALLDMMEAKGIIETLDDKTRRLVSEAKDS